MIRRRRIGRPAGKGSSPTSTESVPYSSPKSFTTFSPGKVNRPRMKAREWALVRTKGQADTRDHVLLSADRDTPFVDPVRVAALREAFAQRGTLDLSSPDSPDSRLVGDGTGRRSVLHVFSGPDREPDALPSFRELARNSVHLLQECDFLIGNYKLLNEKLTLLSGPTPIGGPCLDDRLLQPRVGLPRSPTGSKGSARSSCRARRGPLYHTGGHSSRGAPLRDGSRRERYAFWGD